MAKTAKTRLQYRVQASLYDVSRELLCDINLEPLLDINQDNEQLPLEKVAKQPANAIGKVLNWNDLAPWRRDIHRQFMKIIQAGSDDGDLKLPGEVGLKIRQRAASRIEPSRMPYKSTTGTIRRAAKQTRREEGGSGLLGQRETSRRRQ
jgi:hypothetical protein